MDDLNYALDELIKSSSGEGSRGGHIIRHTKSGKPVYAPRGRHKLSKRSLKLLKEVLRSQDGVGGTHGHMPRGPLSRKTVSYGKHEYNAAKDLEKRGLLKVKTGSLDVRSEGRGRSSTSQNWEATLVDKEHAQAIVDAHENKHEPPARAEPEVNDGVDRKKMWDEFSKSLDFIIEAGDGSL
jgi:hypothetical protein